MCVCLVVHGCHLMCSWLFVKTGGAPIGGGIPASADAAKEKKRKETILDLSKYLDKTIKVKFSGGREASGVLKGFDQLVNLVLDNTVEYLRGELLILLTY